MSIDPFTGQDIAFDKAAWRVNPSGQKGSPSAVSNRAEWAAETIRELAASAEPEEFLGSKAALRELCSVSVGTFNEALKIAEARGFVTVRRGPGGGIFAAQPSPLAMLGLHLLELEGSEDLVAEVSRMRNSLDRLVVEDALMHSSASDIALLRRENAAMRQAIAAGDVREFLRRNWAAQSHLARVSPHPLIRSVFLTLLTILEEHATSIDSLNEAGMRAGMELRLSQYERMADALEAGDREAAFDVMVEHREAAPPTFPHSSDE